MGTEYAFVDDESGEAYDLGKGPWYEWCAGRRHTYDVHVGPPAVRSDVVALLAYWQVAWALGAQPAWAAAVGDAIWDFLERHPGARVVSDLDATRTWGAPDEELDANLRAAGVRVYRQTDSRYEHDRLLRRPPG